MKLFDIQEPGENNENYPIGRSVGIDLGTTNSLIATIEDGYPTIILDPKTGEKFLPSIVAFSGNEVLVGKEALGSSQYISSIKRIIGKGIHDIQEFNIPFQVDASSSENIIKININDHVYDPIQISAEVLKALKERAEKSLNIPLENAVITVPAYFDDAQRTATKQAAQIAGFNVLRLLNEPTAAAIAYNLDRNEKGIFAVYDLGGGTFDVSILRLEKGVFQVLATGGDSELGGDDFDHAIVQYLIPQPLDANQLKVALLLAREAKEHLTVNPKWQGEILGKQYSLTVGELHMLIKPYIDKTIKIFNTILQDAALDSSSIDKIILVGGSTRTPYIKQSLTQVFSAEKVLNTINPEEIVALGAAMQAQALTYGSDSLLLDVTPLSLGIELMGGIMEVIIPRNSPLPMEQKRTYTTYADMQSSFKIHILQGESEKVSECRSLAHFELKHIPKLKAGEVRVEITFRIDADGILSITAYEHTTKAKQEVMVKPSYGLTEGEILTLITKARNI